MRPFPSFRSQLLILHTRCPCFGSHSEPPQLTEDFRRACSFFSASKSDNLRLTVETARGSAGMRTRQTRQSRRRRRQRASAGNASIHPVTHTLICKASRSARWQGLRSKTVATECRWRIYSVPASSYSRECATFCSPSDRIPHTVISRTTRPILPEHSEEVRQHKGILLTE